ncbi:PIN domain-containing protein [Jiangella ureilytica]|uniref:PIN domain-containing protein n=1 Tax=Jiangella ureilytica TaxID=2530374 RepID=A0A4R4RF42_9ACTN|nr:type II toxin-antitoxin system VapC family toxin [Jiangella ureilytica]TDC47981.1 PIN domain-containing protein [Jiangella ureilytica]
MSALVVDCSLVLYALSETEEDEILRQRLSEPRVLNAPHLIDVEVSNALRGLTLGGKLTEARADAIRADFADLHIERMPGQALAGRMWELRHDSTAYDAAYIALAELPACPLLTGDAKAGRPASGTHRAVPEPVVPRQRVKT